MKRVGPLLCIALLAGCKRSPDALGDASGGEVRPLTDAFDGLTVGDRVDVRVELSAVEDATVEIQGSDAARAEVRTDVHGGALHIDAPDARGRSLVSVVLPDLARITKRGKGLVDVRGLAGPSLDVTSMDEGDVRLRGTVDLLRLTTEGAGRIEAKELSGSEVALRSDGTGEVVLGGQIGRLDAALRSTGPLVAEGLMGPVRVTMSGDGSAELDGQITTFDGAMTAGAGSVIARGIVAESVQVSAAGAGVFDLAGRAATLEVRTADQGVVLANPLSVEVARVTMRGTGRVEVNASRRVEGLVSNGELVIGATPAEVAVEVEDSGVLSGTGAPAP